MLQPTVPMRKCIVNTSKKNSMTFRESIDTVRSESVYIPVELAWVVSRLLTFYLYCPETAPRPPERYEIVCSTMCSEQGSCLPKLSTLVRNATVAVAMGPSSENSPSPSSIPEYASNMAPCDITQFVTTCAIWNEIKKRVRSNRGTEYVKTDHHLRYLKVSYNAIPKT